MTYRDILVSCESAEVWPARVRVNERGEYDLWNGFVAGPLFTRETAEKVVAWLNHEAERVYEADTYAFDGDVLVRSNRMYEADYGDQPERIEPTSDGDYCIGGWSYVWTEVEARDVCPDCGHIGYDGHDMRSVPPECTAWQCTCGHENLDLEA